MAMTTAPPMMPRCSATLCRGPRRLRGEQSFGMYIVCRLNFLEAQASVALDQGAAPEHRAYASSEISDTLARLPMPSLIRPLMRLLPGLSTTMPLEVKSFATDHERNNVCACAVFSGTHSGEGGAVPPTGKSTSSDYVYVMEFEDGKIRHMAKIWNAGWAIRELGWIE